MSKSPTNCVGVTFPEPALAAFEGENSDWLHYGRIRNGKLKFAGLVRADGRLLSGQGRRTT